jgi:Tol biopolymer transport system component
MRSRARFFIVAALFAVAACGDSSSPTEGRQPVASVSVAAVNGVLWAGTSRQLAAVVRSSKGIELADRQVVWSGGDAAIATVDAGGRVQAHGAGTTVIAATSEGKRGELQVTVAEADLLFEGYRTGLPEMFVLSLRGGEPARLLPPYTLITDPRPSPDGSKIAFVVADYESSTGDIFVVNRDGSGLKQLTFDSEMDDQPAWSPDGTRIAFRSFQTQLAGDIWVMNADGSNQVKLTPDPLPATTDEAQPAWSPDGSRIAYASTEGGNVDLWTMRADGSDKRRLTATPDLDTEPTWSPDGQRIVFRRSTNRVGSDLAVIDAAGGEVTRVVHDGDAVAPAWSPDGSMIAYAVHPLGGGSPQIYTMHPDGTNVTLRTNDYRWNGGRNPSWISRGQCC